MDSSLGFNLLSTLATVTGNYSKNGKIEYLKAFSGPYRSMCIKLSPYFQNHEVYDSGTILLREIIDNDYQTLREFRVFTCRNVRTLLHFLLALPSKESLQSCTYLVNH